MVGLQARLMSQALRKLAGSIAKTGCLVIFINQIRDKIGVMYGSSETTTGGRALKFFSSVRLDIRKTETLKVAGEMVGSHTRVKVVKNKVAPPFREAEFDIMYGEGISHTGELIDLGVQYDLVQKSGSWFSLGSERIGQGRDNAKAYLRDNPEEAEALETAIRAEVARRQEEKLAKRRGTVVGGSATPASGAVDILADDFDDDIDL